MPLNRCFERGVGVFLQYYSDQKAVKGSLRLNVRDGVLPTDLSGGFSCLLFKNAIIVQSCTNTLHSYINILPPPTTVSDANRNYLVNSIHHVCRSYYVRSSILVVDSPDRNTRNCIPAPRREVSVPLCQFHVPMHSYHGSFLKTRQLILRLLFMQSKRQAVK